MIYGVFSDVHANLEALLRVLEFLSEAGAEGYICCGDIVGYGAEPNECLERVRALPNLFAVCGNHDLAAIGKLDESRFNAYAREAVLWTRRRLSRHSAEYLASLGPALEARDFSVVHGTPRNPAEEYLISPRQFLENARLVKKWPLFMGHTHMPSCFRWGAPRQAADSFLIEDSRELLLAEASGAHRRVALNPGSVGQPRDEDPRASCALYDSRRGIFRVVRLKYDIAVVQAKIRAAGLPEFSAARLSVGR